jgi:hypothetical protein
VESGDVPRSSDIISPSFFVLKNAKWSAYNSLQILSSSVNVCHSFWDGWLGGSWLLFGFIFSVDATI